MQCKSCSTSFEGNFCPNCGQSSNVKRIDTLSLWQARIGQNFYQFGVWLIFYYFITFDFSNSYSNSRLNSRDHSFKDFS